MFNLNNRRYFPLARLGKRARKSEQRELLGALCLWGMRHASRARMWKRLKCYLIGGANVCVCVCVCVTLFSGVCKYKALKDAEKHTFSASCWYLLYNKVAMFLNDGFNTSISFYRGKDTERWWNEQEKGRKLCPLRLHHIKNRVTACYFLFLFL